MLKGKKKINDIAMEKIKKLKRHFHREEMDITNDIINVLEMDVNKNDNYRLEYNHIPIKMNNKKLIKLCPANTKYDETEYIYFRPVKSHKQISIILDYIQNNEYPNAKLYSKKEIIDKEIENEDGEKEIINIVKYTVTLRDKDEVLSSAVSTKSEIDAKFRCMYYYFFGESEEFNEKLRRVYSYDKKILRQIDEIKANPIKTKKTKSTKKE